MEALMLQNSKSKKAYSGSHPVAEKCIVEALTLQK